MARNHTRWLPETKYRCNIILSLYLKCAQSYSQLKTRWWELVCIYTCSSTKLWLISCRLASLCKLHCFHSLVVMIPNQILDKKLFRVRIFMVQLPERWPIFLNWTKSFGQKIPSLELNQLNLKTKVMIGALQQVGNWLSCYHIS